MAPSDTLTSGLSGLQFSGLDNPYGLGATTLAASLPKLINPVGNVGTNLGIAYCAYGISSAKDSGRPHIPCYAGWHGYFCSS